ncbi:MAG: hypothetical protein JWN70_2064, partial [Planctomycetaceae bacterium]|nr:hypothetical protein [Planctomycetaceae bacterium]
MQIKLGKLSDLQFALAGTHFFRRQIQTHGVSQDRVSLKPSSL